MKNRGIFITGTDTGCGKTRVTVAIMTALKKRGMHVAGMKPVASGCAMIDDKLVNDDALQIQAACSENIKYDLVNPWALPDPIAPHVAARRRGQTVGAGPIIEACRELESRSEVVVVEGIGGWYVPLSERLEQADLVRSLGLSVVLVVGLRLGCISHARLTAVALQNDGISLQGWIANHVDPHYDAVKETLEYLGTAIVAPMLGEYPFQDHEHGMIGAGELDLEPLFQPVAARPEAGT